MSQERVHAYPLTKSSRMLKGNFLPESGKTITQKVRVWNISIPIWHLSLLFQSVKNLKARGTNIRHPASPNSETRNICRPRAQCVALPAPSSQQGEWIPVELLYRGQYCASCYTEHHAYTRVPRPENIQVRAHFPQVHLSSPMWEFGDSRQCWSNHFRLIQLNTTYLLIAAEFGGSLSPKDHRSSRKFWILLGVNSLWAKDNAGLRTQKLYLLGSIPGIVPEGSTPWTYAIWPTWPGIESLGGIFSFLEVKPPKHSLSAYSKMLEFCTFYSS